jgi:hypothetical protein
MSWRKVGRSPLKQHLQVRRQADIGRHLVWKTRVAVYRNFTFGGQVVGLYMRCFVIDVVPTAADYRQFGLAGAGYGVVFWHVLLL